MAAGCAIDCGVDDGSDFTCAILEVEPLVPAVELEDARDVTGAAEDAVDAADAEEVALTLAEDVAGSDLTFFA